MILEGDAGWLQGGKREQGCGQSHLEAPKPSVLAQRSHHSAAFPLLNFISSQRQALQPGRNRSYFSVKNLDRKPTFSHLNRNFPCSICFVCLFCPKPFFFFFSEHITKPPQFLQMLLMQISIYCMCSFNGFSNRSQHPGKRVHGTMSSRAPAMLQQVGPQAASPFWQETYER